MSARTAKSNLLDALKQLHIRWQAIKERWDDQARRSFEEDVIAPLPKKIESASKGIEHVLELMSKVHQECGDVSE